MITSMERSFSTIRLSAINVPHFLKVTEPSNDG
jgi:hypothetical protein